MNYPVTQPYGLYNPAEPFCFKELDGSIAFPFDGSGNGHYHDGTDYGCPFGTRIYAPAAGTVIQAGWDTTGFGNRVTVAIDGTPYAVLYGHNSELLVAQGQRVTPGTVLCRTGSTGNSTGPHSHASLIRTADWRYCSPTWGPDGIGYPAFDTPRLPPAPPVPPPAVRYARYRFVRPQMLRQRPDAASARGPLMLGAWQCIALGPVSGDWVRCVDLSGRKLGWVELRNVRPDGTVDHLPPGITPRS